MIACHVQLWKQKLQVIEAFFVIVICMTKLKF